MLATIVFCIVLGYGITVVMATSPLYPAGPTGGTTRDDNDWNHHVSQRHRPWGNIAQTFRVTPTEGHLSSGFTAPGNVKLKFWGGPKDFISMTANSMTTQLAWPTTSLNSQIESDVKAAFGDVYPHSLFQVHSASVVTFSDFTYGAGDPTTPTNTIQFVATWNEHSSYSYWMLNVGDIGWWDYNGLYPEIGLSFEGRTINTTITYDLPGSGTADIQKTLKKGNSNVPGRWIFSMGTCQLANCIGIPNGYGAFGSLSDPIDYVTLCKAEYTGKMCETAISDLDACDSSPCVNGSCTNYMGQYMCTCTAGYTGTDCDVDIDECANMPCIHGNCTDDVNGFNCSCESGYTGDQCETNIDDCASNDCQNGYCVDGLDTFSCVCYPGWTDGNCSTNIDNCLPDPCIFGTCIDLTDGYNCTCNEGYIGQNCDINIDDCAPKPCVRGRCTDGVDSFTCSCEEGFTGRLCEVDMDDCSTNPCANGACIDQEANFTCECCPGWSGELCDFNVDDCHPNPCVNGQCTDLIDGYNCTCEEGFTGRHCDIDVDDCLYSPCVKGVCVDGPAFYNCTCEAGYSGRLCEMNINDCEPDPCDNGFCVDQIDGYKCSCLRGWSGVNCTENIDDCNPNPCRNGVCTDFVDGYNCSCNDGYSGQNCDINIDDCEPKPCVRGSCTDGVDSFTCSCEEGFTGRLCEVDMDDCSANPCVNGVCMDKEANYTCECLLGWSGRICDVNDDDCDPDPCANGQCTDLVNGYNCTCVDGYSGADCITDIDNCMKSPCVNNGHCIDGVNSFSCSCVEGFTGRLCEVDIDDCAKQPCKNGVCLDCVDSYSCQCYPGFSGINCEADIDSCLLKPCQHGTCADITQQYSCTCEAGYSGKNCDIDIDECKANPCIHGTCGSTGAANSYTCSCEHGYTGARCEVNIDECAANPCTNGSCIDGVNSFQCLLCDQCDDDLCVDHTDYCVGNTACRNGGTCVSAGLPIKYYCHCLDGITGRHCENDNRPPIGTWSKWSAFGDCSKTCDSGIQKRTRSCLREPCDGCSCDFQICNTNRCQENADETASSALLVTSKDIFEVVQQESLLKNEVAGNLNTYCSTNSFDCCNIFGLSVSSNFPITSFSVEDVHFASGYPTSPDSFNVQVRLFATLPASLQSVCEAASGLQVRRKRQTSTSPATLPVDLLQRAIGANLGQVHGELCCYAVHQVDKQISATFWQTLIICSVVFGCVVLFLVVSLFLDCYSCKRKKLRRHRAVNRLSGPRYIASYKRNPPTYEDKLG